MDEHNTGIARNTIIERLRLSLVSLILVAVLFLFYTPIALGANDDNTFEKEVFLSKDGETTIQNNVGTREVFNLTVYPITEWTNNECNNYCADLIPDGKTIEECKTENVFFGLKFYSDQLMQPIDCTQGVNCGFKEIYPLQPDWVFKINTPSDVTQAKIKNLGQCPIKIVATESEPLELWSGFKVQGDPAYEFVEEVQPPTGDPIEIEHPSLGNFVPKKVYYYETGGNITALGALNTISASNFPALGGGVWGDIMIMPDTIRAPHWHMTEAESGFCYQGYGKVGAIVDKDTFPSSDGSGYANDRMVQEIFIHPNEIFMFPTGAQHYLRNIGTEPFKCILFLRHGVPTNPKILSAITLQNVLGQTPLGVSAAFTNPKDPSLNLTGYTDETSEVPYKDAASISNYQNEAFKPSQDYSKITVKSADADCTPPSWMTCVPAICPLKDLPEADACANVTNGGPYKSQTP
ncbi:cupin domain-containing protein [Moorena sp. SIO3B2]|uniref:cupin domain-containing protein n=1 Tax=Moorena sp. SIO3B2 TaxID=2607827 RepID=UPI0013C7304D|nr:cupin domain-containing protein [Moorena sp. SIO3B2]NEP36088.1 hypothetical protein [Moorena sp. SIO3B2]